MEDWSQESPSFLTHWKAKELRHQRVGLQERKKRNTYPQTPDRLPHTLPSRCFPLSTHTQTHNTLASTLPSHSLTSTPPTHYPPIPSSLRAHSPSHPHDPLPLTLTPQNLCSLTSAPPHEAHSFLLRSPMYEPTLTVLSPYNFTHAHTPQSVPPSWVSTPRRPVSQ